jgi:hypothetical protein
MSTPTLICACAFVAAAAKQAAAIATAIRTFCPFIIPPRPQLSICAAALRAKPTATQKTATEQSNRYNPIGRILLAAFSRIASNRLHPE